MKFDLVKEHYFFELTRKQQLESSLTLPVAVLTGLGGIVFSLAQSFRYGLNLKSYVFTGSLIMAALCLALTFYYLIRATHRFNYELVPASVDLLNYYEKSQEYYRSIGAPYRADQDFEAELKDAYASASSKNRQNNISKAGYLYKAIMGLVAAAFFLAVSAVPYFADALTKPKEIQRIEIVKPGGTMPEDDNSPARPTGNTNQPTSQPTSAPTSPLVKPTFPANSTTREGDQPRRPIFPVNSATKDATIVYQRTKKD